MTVAWIKTLDLADSFALVGLRRSLSESWIATGPLASLDDSLRRAMQKAGGQRPPLASRDQGRASAMGRAGGVRACP